MDAQRLALVDVPPARGAADPFHPHRQTKRRQALQDRGGDEGGGQQVVGLGLREVAGFDGRRAHRHLVGHVLVVVAPVGVRAAGVERDAIAAGRVSAQHALGCGPGALVAGMHLAPGFVARAGEVGDGGHVGFVAHIARPPQQRLGLHRVEHLFELGRVFDAAAVQPYVDLEIDAQGRAKPSGQLTVLRQPLGGVDQPLRLARRRGAGQAVQHALRGGSGEGLAEQHVGLRARLGDRHQLRRVEHHRALGAPSLHRGIDQMEAGQRFDDHAQRQLGMGVVADALEVGAPAGRVDHDGGRADAGFLQGALQAGEVGVVRAAAIARAQPGGSAHGGRAGDQGGASSGFSHGRCLQRVGSGGC